MNDFKYNAQKKIINVESFSDKTKHIILTRQLIYQFIFI